MMVFYNSVTDSAHDLIGRDVQKPKRSLKNFESLTLPKLTYKHMQINI